MTAGPDPSPNREGMHPGTVAGGALSTDIVPGTDTLVDTTGVYPTIDAIRFAGLPKTMTILDSLYRQWPKGP